MCQGQDNTDTTTTTTTTTTTHLVFRTLNNSLFLVSAALVALAHRHCGEYLYNDDVAVGIIGW